MPDGGLLDRAEGYLRTARAALDNGDLPQAYENARTAAELAAKAMLARNGITATGKDHNVAPALVQAGCWPGGGPGKRLSRFLGDFTRGVYGFSEPIAVRDAERALRLAEQVIEKARKQA
jgi:HEPN domain-containing protein